MTHCVFASDARALTQMHTNTAGTPNVIKIKILKNPIVKILF